MVKPGEIDKTNVQKQTVYIWMKINIKENDEDQCKVSFNFYAQKQNNKKFM